MPPGRKRLKLFRKASKPGRKGLKLPRKTSPPIRKGLWQQKTAFAQERKTYLPGL